MLRALGLCLLAGCMAGTSAQTAFSLPAGAQGTLVSVAAGASLGEVSTWRGIDEDVPEVWPAAAEVAAGPTFGLGHGLEVDALVLLGAWGLGVRATGKWQFAELDSGKGVGFGAALVLSGGALAATLGDGPGSTSYAACRAQVDLPLGVRVGQVTINLSPRLALSTGGLEGPGAIHSLREIGGGLIVTVGDLGLELSVMRATDSSEREGTIVSVAFFGR